MDPCILVSGVSIQKIVLGGLGAVPPVGAQGAEPPLEGLGGRAPISCNRPY